MYMYCVHVHVLCIVYMYMYCVQMYHFMQSKDHPGVISILLNNIILFVNVSLYILIQAVIVSVL